MLFRSVVLTTLHAGGKFGGGGYQVSGGLHGVGVSVVNALSTNISVEIHRDGFVYRQEYERGVPVAPLAKGEKTSKTGTTVTFWADPDVFETTWFDFTTLSRRFQEMAFLNKGMIIELKDERTSGDFENTAVDGDSDARGRPRAIRYQYEGGIADFVRHINASKGVANPTVVEVEAENDENSMQLGVALQWNTSFAESVHTFANTINTTEGGTHEEGFRTSLTSLVNK